MKGRAADRREQHLAEWAERHACARRAGGASAASRRGLAIRAFRRRRRGPVDEREQHRLASECGDRGGGGRHRAKATPEPGTARCRSCERAQRQPFQQITTRRSATSAAAALDAAGMKSPATKGGGAAHCAGSAAKPSTRPVVAPGARRRGTRQPAAAVGVSRRARRLCAISGGSPLPAKATVCRTTSPQRARRIRSCALRAPVSHGAPKRPPPRASCTARAPRTRQ